MPLCAQAAPTPLCSTASRVDYYGSPTPIQQIAAIASHDPRQLAHHRRGTARPSRPSSSAIQESDLGINPQNDGNVHPPRTSRSSRRSAASELVKQIHKYSENGKVAIRNIRRDAMEAFKKKQKASEITEDDLKVAEKDLQKLTDDMCKEVDALLEKKEKELMAV